MSVRVMVLVTALLVGFSGFATPSTQAQPAASARHHKTVQALTVNSDSGIYAFQPKTLKVKLDTRVTWLNPSDTDHNITAVNMNWKLAKELLVGAAISYTFKKPRTYKYSCTIHPGMTGKVIVSTSS